MEILDQYLQKTQEFSIFGKSRDIVKNMKPRTGIILLQSYSQRNPGTWKNEDNIFVRIHNGKYVAHGIFYWNSKKKEWIDSGYMATGLVTSIPNSKKEYAITYGLETDGPGGQKLLDSLNNLLKKK